VALLPLIMRADRAVHHNMILQLPYHKLVLAAHHTRIPPCPHSHTVERRPRHPRPTAPQVMGRHLRRPIPMKRPPTMRLPSSKTTTELLLSNRVAMSFLHRSKGEYMAHPNHPGDAAGSA